MNHGEYKLQEQRFQREIVQLALLSSQSSSSSSFAELNEGGGWTICCDSVDKTLPIFNHKNMWNNIAANQQGGGRTAIQNEGSNNNVIGNVQLAYKRRGTNPWPDDEEDYDSGNELLENRQRGDIHQKQHDYYQAGVSNVAIHYAKVHRSTIPNNDKFLRNQPSSSQQQHNTHESPPRYPTQQETNNNNSNLPSSPIKSAKSILSTRIL